MNKVEVNINGIKYTIKGEENQEEMLRVSAYVDKKIKEITSNNNKLNPTFAAVLSALNITNELFMLRKEMEGIKAASQGPLNQLNELKIEYGVSVKENERLREQLNKTEEDIEKTTRELIDTKSQYETLYNDYAGKNDELSKAYREYELIRREKENRQKELERVKIELTESKHKLIDLQNQLLQNQIELVKVKKEFDEYKLESTESSEITNV